MCTLFKKKNSRSVTVDISRSKYYIDKELHLKGIIYEEKKLEEEYKENEKVLPKVCLVNKTNSPYYDLISDLELTFNKSELRNPEDFISEEGEVEWGRVLNVKKTKELNEVFVDSISVNLNFKDIELYHKILDEELIDVKENLGLYKSSWGYLAELTRRMKQLKSNIEFLKKKTIYEESKTFRVRLVVEFDFFGSGSVDVNRQYFKLESINNLKSLNVKLNSEDCLKLLKLRNWGKRVKEEIKGYLEMRESGINPGKQNHKLIPNYEDELDINISGLDVN
tara:strand:+ start:347 stop:1186 length:840 start_codon:yes stop_codon:yes gene_type:complete